MTTSYAQRAIVLGLLSAVGPFAIDMYLPALPAIGRSLHADPRAVQWSLMSFFVALGVCQLFYGPLSDMFGRKPPLYFGLSLFALTSVACAFASSIETLVFWRFVQGIGACATVVVPRAIVRDLHTGPEAARLMSLLMLVFSVSPVLAPLMGSLAIEWASWRAVFWLVAGLGVLALGLSITGLSETRPASDRVDSTLTAALRGYWMLMRDARFVGLSLLSGFGMAAFFIYLANSSFILIQHYRLTPAIYSLFFSVNAVAFIGTAQFTGVLTRRFGLRAVVLNAAVGHALSMLALCALWAAGFGSLALLATLLFVGYGFLGLIMPTTSVMALDDHGAVAGTAAALMGTLQMVTGALVVTFVGRWADGTPWPMIVGIAGASTITWALSWWTLSRPPLGLPTAIEPTG